MLYHLVISKQHYIFAVLNSKQIQIIKIL